jgi:hypothetical protein
MEMRDIDDWWDGPGHYWLATATDMHYLGPCDDILAVACSVCMLRDRGVHLADAIIMSRPFRTGEE